MTSTRDQFEVRPELRQALNEWTPYDEWLSGGQLSVTAVVHNLAKHFDRLDGSYQQEIAAALSAVAEDTLAMEAPFRNAFGNRPQQWGRDKYDEVYGLAEDPGERGYGLFGEFLHEIPKIGLKTWPPVMLHGPFGGPGNLVVDDLRNNIVWLYRTGVYRGEARQIIHEGMQRAKALGRGFEHTDMRADFSPEDEVSG